MRSRVSCQAADDGQVGMTVADTGPGLSADELSWIFTPFERLGAAQTTIEGTGIGLPLARALAQAMGGTLTATSAPGQGVHRDAGPLPGAARRIGGMRLDAGAARRLFAGSAVARLATVTPAGHPHIVPVTFVLDSRPGQGDWVYTAVDHKPKSTARLQRLRNIQAHPRVALLADHYADDWTRLWWVRADGEAAVLGAAAEAAGAADAAGAAGPLRLLAARYPQYAARPPAGPVIAVRVDRWTGWAAAAAGR